MRHHNHNRKFGREQGVRKALLRSLATSLLRDGKIKTTEAKAKELRPFVEKLVTVGKSGTVTSRRLLKARLGGETVLHVLTTEISPRYKDRRGGYTRIIKLPRRKSDGSKMAYIEFV